MQLEPGTEHEQTPDLRKRTRLELFRRLQAERIADLELHTLFWECTLRCNLHCRHCGSDCLSSFVQPDMPASDFFRTLDTQITPTSIPTGYG